MNFENIKNHYDRGLWTAQMVGNAVEKNVITAAQYQEITGQEYVGPGPEPMKDDTWQFIMGIQEGYTNE